MPVALRLHLDHQPLRGYRAPLEEPMYTVTLVDGTLLALALLSVTTTLVLGVLAAFPRALRTITAGVRCPMLGRRVEAEVVQDAWTLRCVDVRRCAVLGDRVDLCNKGCR